MNNIQKIWLAGITQNAKEDLDILTKDIYTSFDGLIFVEHNSTDGSKELLESRKGEGEIISIPWRHHNGWSMECILTSKKILPQDWVVIVDTLENLNVNFARSIRAFINSLESQNINTVYLYGKIFMFKYFMDMTFSCVTPHCYLQNTRKNAIDLAQIPEWSDERKSRFNLRPLKRPANHFLGHFFRYTMIKASNQMSCGNETNPEEYQRQESARQQFLIYCYRVLGFEDITEEIMTDFIKKDGLTNEIRSFFNYNRYLNNWYRYHFLNHSLDDIIKDNEQKKLFQII